MCVSQTDIIILSISLSHSFLRQSSRHSGHWSLGVGIPESIFGFRQNHFHFHCIGTSFVDQRLQRAVSIVFLTFSDHFFIMLNVRLVGDRAVLVEVIAITVLNSTTFISLSKISSVSLQSYDLYRRCEIPYQMLFNASPEIFPDIFITTVLKPFCL